MNIAGVVILYYPDNDVVKRIKSYLPHIQRLYIVDNSEIPTDSYKEISLDSKIVYLHDGQNKGIATRLNYVAESAINEKYDWLLTMDQDSFFNSDIVPVYFNCITNFPEIDTTAMFGVQFQDQSAENLTCNPKEVEHLITSGSILNLSLFQLIGGFDEALFIDKVDHEYCLKAQLHGYKIIMFHNIYLSHTLGKVTYGRSLKTFRKTPRVLHSPIRMYYIIRNYLYLRDKYKGRFDNSFSEMKEELWIRLKNNFLYSNKKLQLLKYTKKALLDYKTNKMGKISFFAIALLLY